MQPDLGPKQQRAVGRPTTRGTAPWAVEEDEEGEAEGLAVPLRLGEELRLCVKEGLSEAEREAVMLCV